MKTFLICTVLSLFSLNANPQSVTSTANVELDRLDTPSVPLPVSELDKAQLWDLTPQEWERHNMLMLGIRGRLSSEKISPIEVLGIHAQSEAERERYAQKWAQLMLEDAERVLKFQRAYDQAIVKLTQGIPLIDPKRLQSIKRNNGLKLSSDDRILFFTTLDCPACSVVYEQISKLQSEVKSIDIYFVNVEGADQQAIRNWAQEVQISPSEVQLGKVSLNLDNGTLSELAPNILTVPYLMLFRKGKVQKFPLELVP